MFLDGVAFVVLHVPQLLGEVTGSEEGDAVLCIVVIDDDGETLVVVLYFLYWIHVRSPTGASC